MKTIFECLANGGRAWYDAREVISSTNRNYHPAQEELYYKDDCPDCPDYEPDVCQCIAISKNLLDLSNWLLEPKE